MRTVHSGMPSAAACAGHECRSHAVHAHAVVAIGDGRQQATYVDRRIHAAARAARARCPCRRSNSGRSGTRRRALVTSRRLLVDATSVSPRSREALALAHGASRRCACDRRTAARPAPRARDSSAVACSSARSVRDRRRTNRRARCRDRTSRREAAARSRRRSRAPRARRRSARSRRARSPRSRENRRRADRCPCSDRRGA